MATDTVLVFDACAVVAYLDGEAGGDVVEDLLQQENTRCLIHVLNVCEVFYHVHRSAGEARASQLPSVLTNVGFILEDSLNSELWQTAGTLKAEWRRVSLADCFALALACQENGVLVTSDRHELDRIAGAGVCPIRFIR